MQYTANRLATEKWNLNHPSLYFPFENITMRGDMVYQNLPSADYLNSIFNYNKSTGKLTWKKKTSKFATKIKIGSEVGWVKSDGRKQVIIKGKSFYISRIIWKMMTGSIPNNMQIDHEDRDVGNNKWYNLLLKSQSENKKNSSLYCNNKSGVVGVFFHRQSKSWEGQICNNKKAENKRFKTKEEAVTWRKEKEILYDYHKNHGKN